MPSSSSSSSSSSNSWSRSGRVLGRATVVATDFGGTAPIARGTKPVSRVAHSPPRENAMSAEFDYMLRNYSANHLKAAEVSEFVKGEWCRRWPKLFSGVSELG